jgi:hypothetical protein
MPTPLFSKVYMDTMHMPLSSGYKFIVQGCCSLIYWPEWIMLQAENAKAIGKWILNDIIYRWGLLLEIVMDNGPAFLATLCWLEKHYHITHIRISRYNFRANGLVKHSHFEVREAIFKACDRDESKWFRYAYSIFWMEHVMVSVWDVLLISALMEHTHFCHLTLWNQTIFYLCLLLFLCPQN